jgi:cytochrome b561
MQLRNSPNHFSVIAIGFHWLTVALVILAWTLGTFGDELPRGPARAAGLLVHMSAGLAILMLLFARGAWRLGDRPPPVERTYLGRYGDLASRVAHYALYVLLAAVGVVGIVLQFARGDALPIFGLFEIASPWPADRSFARSVKEVHEFLANVLVALAALHAAAALFHHWILRDQTLVRMLPWAARGNRSFPATPGSRHSQ